jgi:DnaJ domain
MRLSPHTGGIVNHTPSASDRRGSERETPAVPTTVQLTLLEMESCRSIVAHILSLSYSGIGVSCNQAICPGTKLTYTHPTRTNKVFAARVAWCKPAESTGFEHGITNENFEEDAKVDHYSVLQISTIAEPFAVEMAYRYLAQRYANGSPTANAQIYRRLGEAYQVLSDPEKRTAYDMERATKTNAPSGAKVERNRLAIKAKRDQLLEMLYWRRVESPYKPVITLQEFETMLKMPKDQLEFNLWFLRDNGLIARSDNACFVITAPGVAYAEALEAAAKASEAEAAKSVAALAGVLEPAMA